MKNAFLLLLVRLLSRFIPKHPESNRILVVSTTALGDSLWATPALESLRHSFPKAFIGLLTSPIGEEILRHNPWVDQTWILQEPMLLRFWALWKTLYRERFDTVLILHASQRLILPLAALLGATRIIGTSGINKGLDSLLTHAIVPQKEHEIVRRLRLVEVIGGKRTTERLSLFLLPEEEPSSTPAGTWIALHPGSKDPFKRWPSSHFIEVGKELSKRGFHILVTGGKEEQELVQEVANAIPGAVQASSSLSVRAFSALLKHLHLLISNDTGPVHIACALGTPVIALYAPTDPGLCGPHQASCGIPISRPPSCVPCLKRKCAQPFCMLQIGVHEVIRRALESVTNIS